MRPFAAVSTSLASQQDLRAGVAALAPWHLDVQITDEVSTAAALDPALDAARSEHRVSFITAREGWRQLIGAIYPDGLEGRTTLDCACNCGAYSFWLKELGSGGGLGFDVRGHWIEQARFLAAHRDAPADGLRFEVCELSALPQLTGETFDVSVFKGIFYHLPDPIHALGVVAERTRELMILNTSVRMGQPDGMLVAARESVVDPMSGVDGLSWFPTGPRVLAQMLESHGFAAWRCTLFSDRDEVVADLGRVELIAARDESAFAAFDAHRARLGPNHAHNAFSRHNSTPAADGD
jgi:tRNA (mo5U34)-methyltransferase